jgi:DNA-binding Xre family transcriptional regulator
MLQVKKDYEDKLACADNKIKHTEQERDTVLANHKANNATSGKVKQVRFEILL